MELINCDGIYFIRMGIGTKIGLIIILLHLIIGFGYMIFMLSPRKSDNNKDLGPAENR